MGKGTIMRRQNKINVKENGIQAIGLHKLFTMLYRVH